MMEDPTHGGGALERKVQLVCGWRALRLQLRPPQRWPPGRGGCSHGRWPLLAWGRPPCWLFTLPATHRPPAPVSCAPRFPLQKTRCSIGYLSMTNPSEVLPFLPTGFSWHSPRRRTERAFSGFARWEAFRLDRWPEPRGPAFPFGPPTAVS